MRRVTSFTLGLVVSACLTAFAQGEAPKASAEFERMKTLVGTWQGKADMGHGPAEMRIEYRLVAGGNALEERLFAGTPEEMVTMYYDQMGKLSLTHYCTLGNRPRMVLKSAEGKSLQFGFDPASDLDQKTERHMHSLTITFDDADTITHNWELYAEGKASGGAKFTVTRVKAK